MQASCASHFVSDEPYNRIMVVVKVIVLFGVHRIRAIKRVKSVLTYESYSLSVISSVWTRYRDSASKWPQLFGARLVLSCEGYVCIVEVRSAADAFMTQNNEY